MSNEIKPKVGDVWEYNSEGSKPRIEILLVGHKSVFTIFNGYHEIAIDIESLVEKYTLIERDGLPYPPHPPPKKEKQGKELIGYLCKVWNNGTPIIAVVEDYKKNEYWINGFVPFVNAKALTKEEILKFKNFEEGE